MSNIKTCLDNISSITRYLTEAYEKQFEFDEEFLNDFNRYHSKFHQTNLEIISLKKQLSREQDDLKRFKIAKIIKENKDE